MGGRWTEKLQLVGTLVTLYDVVIFHEEELLREKAGMFNVALPLRAQY